MSGVYSERFILIEGASTQGNFVVPAGKRAVIRNVSSVSTDTGGGYNLTVNGVLVAIWRTPGVNGFNSFDTRMVLYAGGAIGLFTVTPGSRAICSGYLFADVTGRRDTYFGTLPGSEQLALEPLQGV